MTELCKLGAAGCVILGDPGYHSRFGFRAEPSLILPDVPAEYFQTISFSGSLPFGTVSYHDAFAATGRLVNACVSQGLAAFASSSSTHAPRVKGGLCPAQRNFQCELLHQGNGQ